MARLLKPLVRLTLALVSLIFAASHAQALPCGGGREIFAGREAGWMVARTTVTGGVVTGFTIIGAYPAGDYAERVPKTFLGKKCKFEGEMTVAATKSERGARSISKKNMPIFDAGLKALNAGDLATAEAALAALRTAYDAQKLNVHEAAIYHFLAAPVYRARRQFENAVASAEIGSSLTEFVPEPLRHQLNIEYIIGNLAAGDFEKAIAYHSGLKKNAKLPVPQSLDLLIARAKENSGGLVFTFDNPSISRAIDAAATGQGPS